MIELRHVTKRYGAVEALHDVSFRAPEGQIVGLLGQNGAGKSTTLNILTGYLPPTSGQVLVDGMDLLQNARECKRLIGYLPEKPPLYDEMTVRSYLRFVCELKEVQKSAIAAHVEDIIRTCGLSEVAHRLIGHLSKGYRQRVGVAQSLCGNPKVLVLDEPTVGLDPRQVVEIRALIADLGKRTRSFFLAPPVGDSAALPAGTHPEPRAFGIRSRHAGISRNGRNAAASGKHRHAGEAADSGFAVTAVRAAGEGAADADD